MSQIIERLKAVESQITKIRQNSVYKDEPVQLLLASKTQSPELLSPLTDQLIQNSTAGSHILMGENRAQELKVKTEALKHHPINWHFIGHLQTNKLKDVIPFVSCIHSLDRIKLAHSLQKFCLSQQIQREVLIQINIFSEESKSGFTEQEFASARDEILSLTSLKVSGLMCMAPAGAGKNELIDGFSKMRKHYEQLKIMTPNVHTLSMGMSNDYKTAVECGSTLIRLGRTVFGERT